MIFGYLDPGSGSVILQALVGGFAAVAVTAKLWWRRVTGIFRRNQDEERHAARHSGGVGLTDVRIEPGSFRDPDSRVLYTADGVVRALSARGLDDYRKVAATSSSPASWRRGRSCAPRRRSSTGCARPACPAARPPGLLRHERIPFVSYPYEWPFSMLREAALLQLELVAAALEEGMILKDSSPYNVQWRGSRRCSSTSAPSSRCARASRGSATASSACCSSIR